MPLKLVIHPPVEAARLGRITAAVPAMESALESLKQHGTDWPHGATTLGPMDIFRKVGFDWWHGIEERFAPR